jgi:hypothetical protein
MILDWMISTYRRCSITTNRNCVRILLDFLIEAIISTASSDCRPSALMAKKNAVAKFATASKFSRYLRQLDDVNLSWEVRSNLKTNFLLTNGWFCPSFHSCLLLKVFCFALSRPTVCVRPLMIRGVPKPSDNYKSQLRDRFFSFPNRVDRHFLCAWWDLIFAFRASERPPNWKQRWHRPGSVPPTTQPAPPHPP